MAFVDALVKKGILNRYQVDQVLARAEKLEGGLDEALMQSGIQEEAIVETKSKYYGIPVKELNLSMIYDSIGYVPESAAQHYQIIPIGLHDGVLDVGMINPGDPEAMNAVRFIANKNELEFKPYVIAWTDFKRALESYRGMGDDALDEFEETASAEEEMSNLSEDEPETKGSTDDNEAMVASQATDGTIIEEAPVAKIFAVILRHAIEGRASDIHIESTGAKVKIRFRVDGVLHTSLLLPKKAHDPLVARIKILTKLKIDEKRRPQDGRFPARIDGRKVDFRVSTFPTAYGEKVVIRILDPERGVKRLEDTGMIAEHAAMVREALSRPYGMILVTGPTGSGKTTTLYSMLGEINREKKNVVSLEDPVEYLVDGMNQSQVRPEIGYSFANGLRSILRQDPDVIMVGEIRDKETAQLAVQAALTGHLVLSTLHTNNAIGVIPRLIDMGVDPYLIAPTLNLAIAQRLAKKMCPESQQKVEQDESIRRMFEQQFSDLPESVRAKIDLSAPVYESVPTPDCPAGTRGRIAIYEMFKVDRDLERVILDNPNEQAVYDAVRAKGMMTMKEDAILKSMQGLIAFTEINNF